MADAGANGRVNTMYMSACHVHRIYAASIKHQIGANNHGTHMENLELMFELSVVVAPLTSGPCPNSDELGLMRALSLPRGPLKSRFNCIHAGILRVMFHSSGSLSAGPKPIKRVTHNIRSKFDL